MPTIAVSGLTTIALPVSGPPVTKFRTPAGKSVCSWIKRVISMVVSGVT